MARLFIAALVTETNSFAPFPTGRSAFEETGIIRDGSTADPAGPLAVFRIAADAGVGAHIAVRLGGKTGPTSGDPLDLEVEVMAAVPDLAQMAIDVRLSMGPAVWLRHAGVDIVVCAKRAGVFAPSIFEDLGIRIAERHIVIVKSSSHHEAAYNPIARHTWKVATPGALDLDFTRLAYERRARDFYPLVDPPPAARLIDCA